MPFFGHHTILKTHFPTILHLVYFPLCTKIITSHFNLYFGNALHLKPSALSAIHFKPLQTLSTLSLNFKHNSTISIAIAMVKLQFVFGFLASNSHSPIIICACILRIEPKIGRLVGIRMRHSIL